MDKNLIKYFLITEHRFENNLRFEFFSNKNDSI